MTDKPTGLLLRNDLLRLAAAIATVSAAAITRATPLILIAMFFAVLLAALLVDRRWWYLVVWLVTGTFLLVAAIQVTAGSGDPWIIAFGGVSGTNIYRLDDLEPAARVAVGARTALALHLLMVALTPLIRFREGVLGWVHERSAARRR